MLASSRVLASSDLVDDLFVLASSWWLRGLVLVGAALAADARRRSPPLRAAAVAVAYGLSSLCSTILKVVVDRPRPTGAHLVEIPSSASFPSGHATTAFAAATALAVLVPWTSWWAFAFAAWVAYSRVYLGVHYWSDIIAGAVLGAVVGYLVARVARERWSLTPPPSAPPGAPRTLPP